MDADKNKPEAKEDTSEIKFLWNVVRYPLMDQIRNTVIRNELNVLNSNNIIQDNRFNWIYNLYGFHTCCVAIQIYCRVYAATI
jgi:hypothetical protein